MSIKKIPSYLSKCFALIILISIGCEEAERSPTTPNLSFIKTTKTLANEESLQDWYPIFFAFSGDNLYQIDSRGHSVTLIGTGWSGTESATVFNEHIFGVQGGHLWKCNLNTGVCADLGPNWTGTPHLTNDDEHLYGIQGNRLWKVNTNGGFAQLGNGEWGGETALTFTHGQQLKNNPFHITDYLYIEWGGSLWKVNRNNGTGTWTEMTAAGLNPMIMPHWAGGNDAYFIGIKNGQVWSQGVPPRQGSILNTTIDWTGTSSIAITAAYSDPACGGCRPQNIYLLKSGTIYRLTDSTEPWNSPTYQGAVPGISGVYLMASHLAR